MFIKSLLWLYSGVWISETKYSWSYEAKCWATFWRSANVKMATAPKSNGRGGKFCSIRIWKECCLPLKGWFLQSKSTGLQFGGYLLHWFLLHVVFFLLFIFRSDFSFGKLRGWTKGTYSTFNQLILLLILYVFA